MKRDKAVKKILEKGKPWQRLVLIHLMRARMDFALSAEEERAQEEIEKIINKFVNKTIKEINSEAWYATTQETLRKVQIQRKTAIHSLMWLFRENRSQKRLWCGNLYKIWIKKEKEKWLKQKRIVRNQRRLTWDLSRLYSNHSRTEENAGSNYRKRKGWRRDARSNAIITNE